MIPECYKYWVEDNDLMIPTKEFNNFKDALDYAKGGLVTFVHEVPCTAGDCCDDEDEIVWSWDDTWNDDEACAAVAKRHPDFCPDCGRNQELCECGKFKDQDLFLNLEEDTDLDNYDYELFLDTVDTPVENRTCAECGARLTDGGYCPVCDDGEEDLTEMLIGEKSKFSDLAQEVDNYLTELGYDYFNVSYNYDHAEIYGLKDELEELLPTVKNKFPNAYLYWVGKSKEDPETDWFIVIPEEDMTDEEFASALYEAKKAKEQELSDEEIILNGKYDEDEAKEIRSAKAAADLEKDFFDMQKKQKITEAYDYECAYWKPKTDWLNDKKILTTDPTVTTSYNDNDGLDRFSNFVKKQGIPEYGFIDLNFSDDFIDDYLYIRYDVTNYDGGWDEPPSSEAELRYFECELKCPPEECKDIEVKYYFDDNDYDAAISKEEFKEKMQLSDESVSEIIKDTFDRAMGLAYDTAYECELVDLDNDKYIYDCEPSWEDYIDDEDYDESLNHKANKKSRLAETLSLNTDNIEIYDVELEEHDRQYNCTFLASVDFKDYETDGVLEIECNSRKAFDTDYDVEKGRDVDDWGDYYYYETPVFILAKAKQPIDNYFTFKLRDFQAYDENNKYHDISAEEAYSRLGITTEVDQNELLKLLSDKVIPMIEEYIVDYTNEDLSNNSECSRYDDGDDWVSYPKNSLLDWQ